MTDLGGSLIILPHAIPQALATNAVEDPNLDVRVRNMEKLIDHYPHKEETLAAARAALHDLSHPGDCGQLLHLRCQGRIDIPISISA